MIEELVYFHIVDKITGQILKMVDIVKTQSRITA